MAEPTGLFLADAEENDLLEWGEVVDDGTNTFVVSVGAALHGSYGFDLTWGGSTSNYAYKTLASTYDELYLRCYVRFDTVTTVAGKDVCGLYIRTGGAVQARILFYGRGAGNALGYQFYIGAVDIDDHFNTATFNQDQTYCVEIRWRNETAGGAGAGGGELWIDGVSIISNWLQANGATKGGTVFIGNVAGEMPASSDRVFYDDVKVDSSYIGLYAGGGGQGAMKRFGGVPHMAVNRGVW